MKGNIGGYPGMTAPDFSLRDGDGEVWRLSDHRGKVVVLMFYPGDETPTCTKQMCSVRDRWQEYAATGAEVVGLSSDSVESHKSFARNHGLPLRLLADEGQKVARLYAATSFFPGKSARAVIVIEGEGRVAYRKLRPLIGMLIAPKDDETIAAIMAAQNGQPEQPDKAAAI